MGDVLFQVFAIPFSGTYLSFKWNSYPNRSEPLQKIGVTVETSHKI